MYALDRAPAANNAARTSGETSHTRDPILEIVAARLWTKNPLFARLYGHGTWRRHYGDVKRWQSQ
jgi:hypothetical protein